MSSTKERKCSCRKKFLNHLKAIPSEIRSVLILKDRVEILLLYEYLSIILNYFFSCLIIFQTDRMNLTGFFQDFQHSTYCFRRAQ